MATSVFMGKCSDLENPKREMEICLMNGSIEKPTRTQTGKPGGGGRRKSKLSESTQKEKQRRRGMGVEQLERLRFQERMKKMTEINPLHPLSFQNHHFTTLPAPAFGAYSITNSGSTGVGLGQEGFEVQPALLLQGFGNGGFHGPVVSSGVGPLFSDETFLADPFAVGSGFRTTGNGIEASKELSSIPNNVKWNSEHCGICYKKFRGSGENIICNGELKMCRDMSPVNGFGNFAVGNMFNGGNPYYGSKPTGQEVEVMAVHRKGNSCGGSLLMEYEFFPGKVGGSCCNYKEVINLASTTTVQGLIGGGSLVGEEARASDDHHFQYGGVGSNSNSIDLSLKLSY